MSEGDVGDAMTWSKPPLNIPRVSRVHQFFTIISDFFGKSSLLEKCTSFFNKAFSLVSLSHGGSDL